MKHRKRMKYDNWYIIKFKWDIALYAKCRCGFKYCCSSNVRNDDGSWSPKQEIVKLYPYCPMCGHKKRTYSENIRIVTKKEEEATW